MRDTIGGRIRAELFRLGLGVRDAAGPLKVSKSQVSKIVRDQADPSIETWLALAELTGRSVDYFLTGRDTMPAPGDDVRRVVDQYVYLRDVRGLTAAEAIDRLSTPTSPPKGAGGNAGVPRLSSNVAVLDEISSRRIREELERQGDPDQQDSRAQR